MIRDAGSTFSSNQAVTANAVSTNSWDTRATSRWGIGNPLYVIVQCTVTMSDSGDNSNCTVYLQTSANANMSSATNMQTLGVFATNTAAGTILGTYGVFINPAALNNRYAALYYSMGTGDLSAGSFTAFVTPDPQAYIAYARGYTGPTVQ